MPDAQRIILEGLRAVSLLQFLRQGHLHEAADVAAELAVAVADPEQMHLRQALDVGLQDVCVLVHLIRVVRMETDSGGESKLPDAVLAFLVGRFLRRGVMALAFLRLVALQLCRRRSCRTCPTGWIVRLRDLLPGRQAVGLNAMGQTWLLIVVVRGRHEFTRGILVLRCLGRRHQFWLLTM